MNHTETQPILFARSTECLGRDANPVNSGRKQMGFTAACRLKCRLDLLEARGWAVDRYMHVHTFRRHAEETNSELAYCRRIYRLVSWRPHSRIV